MTNFANSTKWANLGSSLTTQEQDEYPVYDSDITQNFTNELSGKFYVVKPVALPDPEISYVNLGNLLLEQRATILGWIANHATNAEAVARYQVQLDELDAILEELGLFDHTDPSNPVVRKELDLIFIDLPEIYAAPGSVFINSDGQSSSVFNSKIGNQIIAHSGAGIEIFNQSPFTMNVNDTVVRDNHKVVLKDGERIVLEPGNVYLNYTPLTSVTNTDDKEIDILQDALPNSSYDLGSLTLPPLDQDLYITGDVINEDGDITIENKEGSINITGEIRGKNVNIVAARDFNLNTDDWLHTNKDPRQYVDYEALRNDVWNAEGNPNGDQYADYTGPVENLDEAIDSDTSMILAMGSVTVTARYLNINGLIQSGVDVVTLDIASNFNPGNTTVNFTDDDGNVLPGISFGADNVPVDGYFDAEKQAIVLDEIVPQGGKVTLAGQIFSTGNGEIKAAHGYTSVDIDNNSGYDLILNRIDTTTERVGKITIIDTATLEKTVFEVDGSTVTETLYNGTLVPGDPNVEDGVISRIDYAFASEDLHNVADDIYYEPRSGLQYIWTEGQEFTQTTVRKYEKKTFNLFGGATNFEDWLSGDNSYKWQTIEFTDDYPLLESEGLVAPGDAEMPSYAPGTVYTIYYERQTDIDIDAIPGVTQVRDISNDKIYEFDVNATPREVALVSVDEGTGVVTPIVDFEADPDWIYVGDHGGGEFENPAANRFDSDFKNYSITVDEWTTGGGWLRTKTVHTLTTQVEGKKDYYTHTLKADYPIAINFIAGASSPSINIESGGSIYLEDNINSPESGTITINSQYGDVTASDSVAIFGVSPTIYADGEVKVNVEGDKGALNVYAGEDVEIAAVSLDNISSRLKLGEIVTTNGDVSIEAPNGISADMDSISRVVGEKIELSAVNGSIGASNAYIEINSDYASGEGGGFAARAKFSIYVHETVGDMKLIEPWHISPNEGSVISTNGNVYLTTASGSVYDAYFENFTPSEYLGSDIYIFSSEGGNTSGVSKQDYPLSAGMMMHLYPHAEMLGNTPEPAEPEKANIAGGTVYINAGGNTSNIGRVSPTMTLNMSNGYDGLTLEQVVGLSSAAIEDIIGFNYEFYKYVGSDAVGVDLGSTDYKSSEWQKIATNYFTDYDRSGTQYVEMGNGQTVLVQYSKEEFGLYRYIGQSSGFDLTQQDFGNQDRWEKVSGDYDTEDGVVDIENGEVVENRFIVDYLTMRVWDDLEVDASGTVTLDAGNNIAVEGMAQLNLNHAIAGNDIRLAAADAIIDTYLDSDAAITLGGNLYISSLTEIEGGQRRPQRVMSCVFRWQLADC